METYEAIRTVLAVRAYEDRPVPAETIRRIVEAGRLTGSSMNLQPWHFVVVEQRETLVRLGALAQSGRYTADAAFAIIVATEPSRFAVSDGSRAIQSMMLAAWAEGVGSNWVGFQGMDEAKALLGIPAEMDVLAIVPFGYPTQALGQGIKNRKTLAEVGHRERFGNPFA